MPTYFGAGEEDDDIPDMEEFDEADNVVENDTVRFFCSLVFDECLLIVHMNDQVSRHV